MSIVLPDLDPVYLIELRQVFPDGRAFSTRLLKTKGRDLAEKCADAVRGIVNELPPINKTLPSNARPITLIIVADRIRAMNCKEAGRLKWIPNPGQRFESVSDCARKLGISHASLAQAFRRARIENHGLEGPADVFGLRLAYCFPADQPVGD